MKKKAELSSSPHPYSHHCPFHPSYLIPHPYLGDAHAERVGRVEQQRRLGGDVCRPLDARDDPAVDDAERALEDAADDALLPPDVALAQLAVGEEAGELGAGPGAAGRAVVCHAGAEDEIAAVGVGVARGAEQLDVIDQAAVGAGDALALQRPADAA